jgi:hypothetical protein
MSIQGMDIAGSLTRAPLVQQAQSAQQDAERVAAKQAAADLEKLAQAAEEEVGTTAPTAGKSVHERDAGQSPGYAPPRRRPKAPPPPEEHAPATHPCSPDEGTLLDIEA